MRDRPVEEQARGGVATGTVWVPPAVRPFLAGGVVAVVVGGVVAALSRPIGWERGPWVAAFLVLVVGVGQAGLAMGQSAGPALVSRRAIEAEVILGNGGALLVIVGTLSSSPAMATAGSLLFGAAIALFAHHGRGSRGHRGWVQRLYLALLVVLALSVPMGVALSWLRA